MAAAASIATLNLTTEPMGLQECILIQNSSVRIKFLREAADASHVQWCASRPASVGH